MSTVPRGWKPHLHILRFLQNLLVRFIVDFECILKMIQQRLLTTLVGDVESNLVLDHVD